MAKWQAEYLAAVTAGLPPPSFEQVGFSFAFASFALFPSITRHAFLNDYLLHKSSHLLLLLCILRVSAAAALIHLPSLLFPQANASSSATATQSAACAPASAASAPDASAAPPWIFICAGASARARPSSAAAASAPAAGACHRLLLLFVLSFYIAARFHCYFVFVAGITLHDFCC